MAHTKPLSWKYLLDVQDVGMYIFIDGLSFIVEDLHSSVEDLHS